MTPEEKAFLQGEMDKSRRLIFDTLTSEASDDMLYNFVACAQVLQLDRIATALERPTPNYDPHVSTALGRIAQATEGLESVLPRG